MAEITKKAINADGEAQLRWRLVRAVIVVVGVVLSGALGPGGCKSREAGPKTPANVGHADARTDARSPSRASDARTNVGLDALVSGIARCTSWSPINGLSPSRCKPMGELLAETRGGKHRIALARYLDSPSAPVRYAVAYALCHPNAWIMRDPRTAQKVLDILDKEPTQATITWLGQLLAAVSWKATGLGSKIREMASSHPNRLVRYALMYCFIGGRGRPSDARFEFVLDRARNDKDPHARLLALGSLVGAYERSAKVCAAWVGLARNDPDPEVAGNAAMQIMWWKGDLAGRHQNRCPGHHRALLAEIFRRMAKTGKDLSYGHLQALDRLCDPRHASADINRQCWMESRRWLAAGRQTVQLIRILGRYAPDGAKIAKRYLKSPKPEVRRAARTAADPQGALAEDFVAALGKGQAYAAHHLVGRDRWDEVRSENLARWIKDNVAGPKGKVERPLGFKLVDRRDGQATGCWRRRYPGSRCTGPCRKWTTRYTEFTFQMIGYQSHRRRPYMRVRVADYHNQPPHPDNVTEQTYKSGRRYNIVGFSQAWSAAAR